MVASSRITRNRYYLNPKFYYANPNRMEIDTKVMNGSYDCLQRLVLISDEQDKISIGKFLYWTSGGLFRIDIDVRYREINSPVEW